MVPTGSQESTISCSNSSGIFTGNLGLGMGSNGQAERRWESRYGDGSTQIKKHYIGGITIHDYGFDPQSYIIKIYQALSRFRVNQPTSCSPFSSRKTSWKPVEQHLMCAKLFAGVRHLRSWPNEASTNEPVIAGATLPGGSSRQTPSSQPLWPCSRWELGTSGDLCETKLVSVGRKIVGRRLQNHHSNPTCHLFDDFGVSMSPNMSALYPREWDTM